MHAKPEMKLKDSYLKFLAKMNNIFSNKRKFKNLNCVCPALRTREKFVFWRKVSIIAYLREDILPKKRIIFAPLATKQILVQNVPSVTLLSKVKW